MRTKKINTTVLFLIAVLCISTSITAQKYVDKKGTITFEASEALFEPVKAVNKSVTVILNMETSDIASLALMKGFRFKNSLMEEHFNENYIESETYPKATFKGKLIGFNSAALTESGSQVEVDGKIQLRGKEKEVKTTLTMKKLGDAILIQGDFIVTPSDFDIDIPSVVQNKIAKEINVSLDFNLSQK